MDDFFGQKIEMTHLYWNYLKQKNDSINRKRTEYAVNSYIYNKMVLQGFNPN